MKIILARDDYDYEENDSLGRKNDVEEYDGNCLCMYVCMYMFRFAFF